MLPLTATFRTSPLAMLTLKPDDHATLLISSLLNQAPTLHKKESTQQGKRHVGSDLNERVLLTNLE